MNISGILHTRGVTSGILHTRGVTSGILHTRGVDLWTIYFTDIFVFNN